jgi:ppGpp synthetase/RelA/SpoT-type nucleotidyltranferase
VASRYEEARAAYIEERPIYEKLVLKAEELLEEGLREAGVQGEVEGRAKEVMSFLRKLLRNPKYINGEKPIQDKAGVRVVVPYFHQAEEIGGVIERFSEIDSYEETIDRLGADRLGYLAIHYIVRIRPELLTEDEQILFSGRQLEIQVGSIAQRAWAEVSHDLTYKGFIDIPVAYQRILNRLVALMEVFDSEVGRAHEAIADLPEFSFVPLISELDRELLPLTRRAPDRTLSQIIVPPLAGLYGTSPEKVFESDVKEWINSNRERLGELYERYEDDLEANPIFCQPEALLIFERSENDPDGLRQAWPIEIPRELMISLTELWGSPVE